MEEKFEKERVEILRLARQGIESNIPLTSLQKKYIKNLLLFSMMNASKNDVVLDRNFIKLVNKTFKGFLVKIIKDSDDDDEDIDENLEVALNNIIANAKNLDLNALQEALSPKNITNAIRASIDGVSSRLVLKKLLSLRDLKTNYRETPAEEEKRRKRAREYERENSRQGMTRGRVITREHSR